MQVAQQAGRPASWLRFVRRGGARKTSLIFPAVNSAGLGTPNESPVGDTTTLIHLSDGGVDFCHGVEEILWTALADRFVNA